MTFTTKYEILQLLTRGQVETFLARNTASNERVVVHIFECPEQKPHQPTVQWVLESFHLVAPEPVELVVDTGRYAGTSYAYLVTKLPSDDLLQRWIQSYEGRREPTSTAAEPLASATPDLSETKAISPQPAPSSERPTAIVSSDATRGFTRDFEALRLGLSPSSHEAQASEAAATGIPAFEVGQGGASGIVKAGLREPGEFTKEFFAGLGGQEKPAAVEPAVSAAGDVLRPESAPPGDATVVFKMPPAVSDADRVSGIAASDMFRSAAAVDPEPGKSIADAPSPPSLVPATPSSVEKAPAKTGLSTEEFESFFRGPFNGEKAQVTPNASSSGRPPVKSTGEFTRQFGPVKGVAPGDSSASQPFKVSSPGSSDPGSLSGILADLDNRPPASSSAADLSPWSSPLREPKVRRFSTEQDPLKPASTGGASAVSADLRAFASSPGATNAPGLHDPEPAGATRVFSGAGRDPLCDLSALDSLPAGPSEYTRIISGGMKGSAAASEALGATSSGGPSPTSASPRAPAIPAPAAPAIPYQYPPAPSVPSVPQFPQAGAYPQMPAPPAMPGVPVPQPPPPPAVVTPAAPPWGLIIALNVLVILAVAVILYFALKH